MAKDDVIPGSVIPGGEVTDDFENWGGLAKILQYIAAGFNPFGPQGSSNPEYRTLEAYLRQIFGPLPEGAVDYAADDLNGDGVNELYAVDADGNPLTVYGYDSDGNTESSEFNQWQYDSFLNEIENVETDEDFLDIVNRYESAGIQNNSVVMSMTGPSGIMTTPEDVFKDMMEKAGTDAAVIADVDGILKSDGTLRGVLENVDILIQGIFNLPIPDWLRNVLPAIFKLPSIVDIWDNTFGKVLEGVDEGCFGEGEASAADCTGQILDGVGNAVGGVTEAVKDKVTEAYEGVVGAIDKPEDAVEEVYEWLKGIFGEDPLSMPPWIWGVIGAGILGKEILGGLEDIYGTDVDDDGTIGVPPVETVYGPDDPNPDCVAAGAATDENGGCVCPEGSEYIEASKSCEPTGPVVNEVEEDCKQKGREYNEVTDSCGPCKLDNYEPDSVTGECVEVSPPPPPTQIDCTQPQPGYTPSFNPADNAAHFEWEEACGATHCPDGSEKPASGVCGEQPTCANGAVNAPDCNDCGDNTSPDMHEGGDCSKPLTQQQPQPCANGATLESDCLECPEGQEFNAENKCVTKPTTGTPPGALGFAPDCNKPRPTGTVTFDLIEQQRAWDLECGGGGGSFNCNSLNRSTNEDGSCGECLPGYVFDENMDNCVKQEIPVTTTTPTTETPESASASVGGSAGGAFSPFIAGISYTPQPVPEVIQQPAGMFTGAQPRSNTKAVEQSIVKTLLPEYFA